MFFSRLLLVLPLVLADPFTCYVGLKYEQVNTGQTMACNGMCGNVTTTILGNPVELYYCDQYNNYCYTLNVENSCGTLVSDRSITGCCCNDASNCNTEGGHVTAPPLQNSTSPTISCFNGVTLNGNIVGSPVTAPCQGSCTSLTIPSSLNGKSANFELYSCFPTNVFDALDTTNSCVSFGDAGINVCNCNMSDNCLLGPNSNSTNLQRLDRKKLRAFRK